MSWWVVIIAVMVGFGMTVISVILGAYVMFRAKSPEPFFKEKGEVFKIEEPLMEFPDVEKNVVERTKDFLKNLDEKS